MNVSVLVPYRPDSPERDAAWAYVRQWWEREHPDWQIITGACPDGPWVKAEAVADALSRADGDLLVLADADVICHGVGAAVDAVRRGAPWAVPHRGVHRLAAAATTSVLAGGPLPDPGARPNRGVTVESYTGVAGGGLTALPRAAYERVPLDPRFLGWGSEDLAWSHALLVTYGGPWRGVAPLVHLWHPPASRMTRAVGSAESLRLLHRYRASPTPDRIAALLAEIPIMGYAADKK